LKFTNSASVGLARETNSVLQAVKLHGPKKAISQVLMAASVDVQAGLLSSWDQSLQNWYQRRSVMIASVASAFAGRLEVVSADTSFILGLYQEIGCLVLARQYGRSYDHVIGRF